MKKILGLDLGTNSIGWAVVNEAENAEEKSSIVKLGVRVNPLTVDEQQNFEKGKSITTNADRTLKRSMRRNLQRYKLRRENLIEILTTSGLIDDKTILAETDNATTFQTYRLRAKAATEEISLSEFVRVLLMINKKRGYKSSRKAKGTEDGTLIDDMKVAELLYNDNLTPGQYCLQQLQNGKKYLPDFYRSDLQAEFNRIWDKQKEFYPFLTDELKEELNGKNEKATWAICASKWEWQENGITKKLVGEKRNGSIAEQKIENFVWRDKALNEKMLPEQLIIVLQKINGQINNASGYLGAISDRSKELYFNHQTVGQYQMAKLAENPNYSLKNQVFYRQDYLDEFERIWETQAKFHKELTPELKKEICNVVIFYQRPLKSCKGLISFCEFESRQIEIEKDGQKKMVTVGNRVIPRSSPLFQEFKIWQTLNNVEVSLNGRKTNKRNGNQTLFDNSKADQLEINGHRSLFQEEKERLAKELFVREKMTKAEVLKLLFDNSQDLDLNFKAIDGNRTGYALFQAYNKIIETSGHETIDFTKSAEEIIHYAKTIFDGLGWNTDILEFDSDKELDDQPFYMLWHLLYSFEGDNSKTGNEKLIKKLKTNYGFDTDYAKILANVTFLDDYGSLSAKAIRKILPHLKEGNGYDVACIYAGYGKHSKSSLTKEEIDKKVLKDKLDILPKNSLRNPVVEKILNQMIHVVNGVIEAYGKPDEIRIELARELKKSAKEREELSKSINETTKIHEQYCKILREEFGIANPTRNDIIRYKLYQELAGNGYKTLYSNQYISPKDIFSKRIDIEHIIPQAVLFDDSFSNKTLEFRDVNIEKGKMTAFDFVKEKYGEQGLEEYKLRVERLFDAKRRNEDSDTDDTKKAGTISKAKYKKLLMTNADIPDDFIDRDLRNTQYIAKKSCEILNMLVKTVVPTTGSVTDRLREDWQLVDMMKELNFPKYDKLGMTFNEEHVDYETGEVRTVKKIKDWTKRNDHRHHAMDALTIAFTKRNFIQYLNNLNARVQKGVDEYIDLDNIEIKNLGKDEKRNAVYGIERKELYRDKNGRLRFNPPMPLDEFRAEAKRQLENILVSIKAKNKVVTRNINKAKNNVTSEVVDKDGNKRTIKGQLTLTPRGQLHNETIYGRIKQYKTNDEKVGGSFDAAKIATVASKRYREALAVRSAMFGGDAKKAFTGKNSLEKNPIFLDELHTEQVPSRVKTVTFENVYTVRKEISKDLKLDKVIDVRIRKILEQRLQEFGGDAGKAFSNLAENPIWLNKEKGIQIKRVTISGVSNAEALHQKHDHHGQLILDKNGQSQPVDFVSTSNNHHVAIYRKPVTDKKTGWFKLDENGNIEYELEENIVSFYEATARANAGLPIIDKTYKQDEGWQFLFTMKQNEYFVFPRYEKYIDDNGKEQERISFNPLDYSEEWYKNPDNYAQISPNLFRVQKITTKDYFFRHHLETTVETNNNLKEITWKRGGLSVLAKIVKVRINHIGQIVAVGEY